jgi:hypothetical protein
LAGVDVGVHLALCHPTLYAVSHDSNFFELPPSSIIRNYLDELGPGMALPPELIDEILTYLQDDEKTLQNCSLIAKSWAYSSQKLLCAHVHLTPWTYRRWRETVSPTSAELLQHVRTMDCRAFHTLHPSHGDYFRSLRRLERLALRVFVRIEPDITNLFLAFQSTLSSLSLSRVSITWIAFINVVDYFPNLKDLHLSQSSFVGDCREIPPLSKPPRGKLCLFTLSSDDMSILSSGLSASVLRYNELEITNIFVQIPSRAIRSIISTCGKTLTRLVLGSYDCKFRYHALSSDVINIVLYTAFIQSSIL